MSETNWTLEENGACIADVSNEATHVASSAANLLSSREDLLWITGDAPQHVTIELNRSHPPLLYAGWHVWHDYMTNPKTVELASGETKESISPLIICQALPGEGTQVWRLPGSGIPSNHRFVRFRITETFGPGPTYMNNVVLLAADPGPNYQSNSGVPAAAGVPYPARTTPRSAGAARGGPPPSWNRRDAEEDARSYEPLFRGPSSSAPAAAASSSSSALARNRDDSVGVFRNTRRDLSVGAGARTRSASSHRPDNTGRMSQLLRDLDDDIKLLKPIKSVSPAKNMLLYVPQEAPQIPPLQLEDVYDDSEQGAPMRSMSYRSGPSSQSARQPMMAGAGPASMPGANSDPVMPQQPPQQVFASSVPAASPSMPAGGVYYLSPPPNAPYADIPRSYQDRLSALEQAVASLTQSVQHQREDLTMIKRLLLQQATERRREAERRLQKDIAAPPPPPPAAPSETRLAHRASDPEAAGPTRGGSAAVAPPAFTTQHVAVDFPEDALRSFVQSVMADQVKKHAKKSEARVLHRLDAYLQQVVQSIADSVDDRVQARLESDAFGPRSDKRTDASSARKASRQPGNSHGASANTSLGEQHARAHGEAGPSISIVKDSSFDTSGSGGRQYRY